MTALYEIAEMRDVLDQWLAETDGELTPELDALLTDLDGAADEKIERVALYIRERKATAKLINEQAELIAAKAKREEKAAESLTNYLTVQMQRLGKERVNGLLATVAFQKNPPSVRGDLDQGMLALLHDAAGAPYVKHIPDLYVLDRRAVLDAYKAGQPLPDGLTVEQTTSLRIR